MSKRKLPQVPREDWLASQNEDVYVAAIMCCQHGDPSRCSADQRCHMDGVCFPGGTIGHQRRELRHHIGELARMARELRAKLNELQRTNPRAVALADRKCPHCGLKS